MFTDYILYFYIASAAIALLLAVWILSIELRMKKLFRGKKAKDLESLLVDLKNELKQLNISREEIEKYLELVEKRLKKSIQQVGILRFNPFEERAGKEAEEIAKQVLEKYQNRFAYFLITKHPKDLPGEIVGKGSNITWAAEEGRKKILDANNIKYEDVLISAFDIDTRIYPQYFLCLTWHFLTCENPYRSSFQPVPVYNNNIWDAPALSRVVATSGTFWQMIQQERPERLATFSSHSMSFKALYEVGYWQKNIVSEDSRIFWNSLLHFDGSYWVIPISYPVSMDANLGPNFWVTIKNIYQQQRRWTWGVENIPYLLFGLLKNKTISFKKKLHFTFVQIEGFWSLATNPLIIFFSWLASSFPWRSGV